MNYIQRYESNQDTPYTGQRVIVRVGQSRIADILNEAIQPPVSHQEDTGMGAVVGSIRQHLRGFGIMATFEMIADQESSLCFVFKIDQDGLSAPAMNAIQSLRSFMKQETRREITTATRYDGGWRLNVWITK